MICQKCKNELPDKAKFCLECGASVSGMSAVSGMEAGESSLSGLRTMQQPASASTPKPSDHTSPDDDLGDRSLSDLRTMQGVGERGETTADPRKGTPLSDRYELAEEIGRGGFARVWKARDRKLDRTVAVKRLLDSALEGAAGRQTLDRFEREATAIAQLNHRNIVMVYDHDADAEGHYIVMECVEGGTLRDYLKNQGGKLPVAEAVAIVKGIAQGLGYAHRKNLVHRDIKPANILLDTSDVADSAPSASPRENIPNPKIVDFGLARLGSESELSLSGFGMGTPWYMPPEQRRNAKGVNHTADIYALGKVLYELVSGDVPDNVDPDKIPEKWLVPVILRCIKSNPEERYFSCEDMVKDLAGKDSHAAVPAPPEVAGNLANNCPSCGTHNPADVKFCRSCGTGLCRSCPECEHEDLLGVRYCGGCGTDIDNFIAL